MPRLQPDPGLDLPGEGEGERTECAKGLQLDLSTNWYQTVCLNVPLRHHDGSLDEVMVLGLEGADSPYE